MYWSLNLKLSNIRSFMPLRFISKKVRRILDSFYLLISKFEKLSTSIWRLPFAVNVILNLSNNYSWRSIERIPKRSRNSIHNWSMVRTEFWMENLRLFPDFFQDNNFLFPDSNCFLTGKRWKTRLTYMYAGTRLSNNARQTYINHSAMRHNLSRSGQYFISSKIELISNAIRVSVSSFFC